MFSEQLKVAENILIQELETGESVLLNLNNESYYGLDKIGTEMWKVLTSSSSIEDAYEKLLNIYEVEPKVLKNDIENLIQNLLKNGILEISNHKP